MRGAVVDVSEQIKWWNILDLIRDRNFEAALDHLIFCQHPDCQWFLSVLLTSPGERGWTADEVKQLMLERGDDPRALFIAAFAYKLPGDAAGVEEDDEDDNFVEGTERLRIAAEMGYAPAQSSLLLRLADDEQQWFALAQSAAAQDDRYGLHLLSLCYRHGYGCAVDEKKAIELEVRGAELEDLVGLYQHGVRSFGENDWRRYNHMGRSAARGGVGGYISLLRAALERRDRRVQFEIGAAHQRVLASHWEFGGNPLCEQRVAFRVALERHNKCHVAAKAAIECWLVVGRRLRVVKDIRRVIAKMLRDQPWEWMEEDEPEPAEDTSKKARVELCAE
jgi:hypothetical protein